MKNKKKINPMETKGAYITQPISQADKRSRDAKIAMPNDESIGVQGVQTRLKRNVRFESK